MASATSTKRRGRAKTRPIPKLGFIQRKTLDVLARRKTPASAVEIRDRVYANITPLIDDDTRKIHAVLRRLHEAGYVSRTGKLGDERGKSGSVVTFSITNEGREARKAK